MVTIRPFCAVRPAIDKTQEISALPYDVYSRGEAKEYVSHNPLSFLRIDRAETSFDDSVGTYDSCVYEKALELYSDMKDKHLFIKDDKPGFYIYALTMNGRRQIGLVACSSCEEYASGIIKKHENTRADKELDRINHVTALNAQTGPIFLAYRNNHEISAFMHKYVSDNSPYVEFESEDGILHQCWIINDSKDITYLTEQFNKLDGLYVADGHHRLASAYEVSKKKKDSEEAQYFLSVIFSEDELMILDYNRVVKDLNGMNSEEFLDKVSERFYIKELVLSDNKPSSKGSVYMFLDDNEYEIRLKEEYYKADPVGSLDVSLLQDNLLKPILGIDDPKTDHRIDFVGGIRGIKELRRRMTIDGKVAFALYPTQMSELFDVADEGLLMPPKSTWFEPKLRSGLFIHEI